MNPERQPTSERSSAEVEKLAGERAEQLKNKQEKSGERGENKAEKVESAKNKVEAAFSKEPGKEAGSGETSSARAVRNVGESARKSTYKKNMKQIQSEMSAPSRTFSKFIHNPGVEKTSETLGSTVARPNALLSGSFCAFVLVTGLYLIAKHYGYTLSGFETIGAFVLGWIIGLIYDYTRVAASGRR